MDILKLRHRLLRLILVPLGTFAVSYAALVFFFSQQSGHILWENLVASAIFAAIVAFFVAICLLSKWFFWLWLGVVALFYVIGMLNAWEGFSINFIFNEGYTGSCPVSFYCLSQNVPIWLGLLIQTAFEFMFWTDMIVGATLLLRTLIVLNSLYPQTKYFLGTFILGLFTFLLSFVQRIPDVPAYTGFQYAVLGLFGLFTLVSFCFGFFYKKLGTQVDKFKRIYGAAVMAFILLLPLLIPFDVSSAEDQKAALFARIGFGTVALFSFVYLGFFAKLRSTAQTLNGSTSITRSKNKRSRH